MKSLRNLIFLTGTSFVVATRNQRQIFPASGRNLEVCPSWSQLGIDIEGEVDGDASGYAVALSNDGSVVAIGSTNSNGNGAESGNVRVYALDATRSNWEQRGPDIDGEAAEDRSGYSVSMSNDGLAVAIGARYNDGNGLASGHVRIFDWSNDLWEQRGQDINGDAAGDYFGTSVSMSNNGKVVAIGADGADNGVDNYRRGKVRIYEWIDSSIGSSSWVPRGALIEGEANNDRSGISVSMSNDGSMVAIGANNDDSGTTAGHVRVYAWKTDAWTQLGEDIDGERTGDGSGRSVSLSGNGLVLAIGANGNDNDNGKNTGHVRTYTWNEVLWSQRGVDIDGELAGDNSGISVSMSDDGTTVAVGAHRNDGNGVNSGHVRLFDWVENDTGNLWVKRGEDIDGEEGNNSGQAVSLSNDGTVVAIGAIKSNGSGTARGHVRVMKSLPCPPTSSPSTLSPTRSPSVSPSLGPTTADVVGRVTPITESSASKYNEVGRKVILAVLFSMLGWMI